VLGVESGEGGRGKEVKGWILRGRRVVKEDIFWV
jgi:hypothetical protein